MCGRRHTSAAVPPGKRDPVPIVQGDGWASEPIESGAENLTLTEIRSPDHSPRS